jgi:hypothetical protein
MLYEVRTYTLRPGTVASLNPVLPSDNRHGKSTPSWERLAHRVGTSTVIHVWPYDDLQHRMAVRTAMANDNGGSPRRPRLHCGTGVWL